MERRRSARLAAIKSGHHTGDINKENVATRRIIKAGNRKYKPGNKNSDVTSETAGVGPSPSKRMKNDSNTPVIARNLNLQELSVNVPKVKKVTTAKDLREQQQEMAEYKLFENTSDDSEVENLPSTSTTTTRPRREKSNAREKKVSKALIAETEGSSSDEDSSGSEYEEPVTKNRRRPKTHVRKGSRCTKGYEDLLDDSDSDESHKGQKKKKKQSTSVVRFRDGAELEICDEEKVAKKRPERCFMSCRWKSTRMDQGEDAEEKSLIENSAQSSVANTVVAGERMESKEQPKWVKDCLSIAASLARHRSDEITLNETAHIMWVLKKREKEQSLSDIATDIQENKGNYLKTDPQQHRVHSSSEDEWEEMEMAEETKANKNAHKTFQITIDKEKVEIDWTVKWFRQEINRCIKARSENSHKIHFLFWIYYLYKMVKQSLDEDLATSLALSQIPAGYVKLCENTNKPIESLKKFAKWIHSAFQFDCHFGTSTEEWGCRFEDAAAMATAMRDKSFGNDIQRAMAYFVCFRSLNLRVRLVGNCLVLSRKKDLEGEEPKEKSETKRSKKKRTSPSFKDVANQPIDKIRNFWIEFWSVEEKKWICVDPLNGEIDKPSEFEANLSLPAIYLLACDNECHMRDVGARYLSTCTTPLYRRQRTEQKWIDKVFNSKMIRADKERAQLEDLSFQNDLASQAMPKTIADYKNHPLYVLEKDLLKFQAIYPPAEKQKPLGEIRGQKIYPRSTVYTLQGDLNWIKLARSVKENEKPYKIVKARPNMRVPVEERGEPKDLPLYGFWQTEPYRVPVVTNGIIPRNQFGNIYVYQPSMVPKGCVHLNLPGIVSICRRLNKEHVVAVVGWDFHVSANHPVLEGAVVLNEDADELIAEWEAAAKRREIREKKRREERILTNWRKLIRGVLRLHKMRHVFGDRLKEKAEHEKKDDLEALPDKEVEAENQAAWPAPKFTLDTMKKD